MRCHLESRRWFKGDGWPKRLDSTTAIQENLEILDGTKDLGVRLLG